MSRIESEQRTIRAGLSTFLSNASWSGLSFSEGWEEVDITNPLVNIYVIDSGKQNLELGYQSGTHKLYNRIAQIDVFMETESRVREICEDIMDYMSQANPTISDILTTSGVGYLSFPNDENIHSAFLPPALNNPEILRWRGIVRGEFEAYYPNGGNPL